MPDALRVPIIDVAALDAADPERLAPVADTIGRACREIGFFYAAGHQVPPALLADAFAASRRLFSLPPAETSAVAISKSPHNRGYVGMQAEALDPTKPPDLKEAFNIGLELAADDPEVIAGLPFRGVNLWPQLAGSAPTMLSYYDAVWSLGRRLHRAFAVDLGPARELFRGQARPAHGDPAPPALSAHARQADRRPAGRGRAHRLWQSDSAGDRRIGWAGGAHARRRLDCCADGRGRVPLQHRRLSHALDQRRLCLDTAPGRQPRRAASATRSPSSSIPTPRRWWPCCRPARPSVK